MAAWYEDLWNGIKGTGQNIEDFFTGKQAGDVKAAYDQAIGASQRNMADLTNFYDTRRNAAQQFYGPMQQLFAKTYGTQGIQGPMVPQAGMGPMQTMYGGK